MDLFIRTHIQSYRYSNICMTLVRIVVCFGQQQPVKQATQTPLVTQFFSCFLSYRSPSENYQKYNLFGSPTTNTTVSLVKD